MPPRKKQAAVPQRRSQRQAAQAPRREPLQPIVPPALPPPVPPAPAEPARPPTPDRDAVVRPPAPANPPDEALAETLARIRMQADNLQGERREVLLASLQEFERNFGQMLNDLDAPPPRDNRPLPPVLPAPNIPGMSC